LTTSTPPDTLPRRNGELAFDAPWQSRAFGLAAAYLDATGQNWDRFRPFLVGAIADLPESTPYYDAWVVALDRMVTADGVGGFAASRTPDA
jgi:hypothetical protein